MPTSDTTNAENTLYVAIELSASAWLAAVRLPGVEKVNLHRMDAGDRTALLAFIGMHRARAEERLGAAVSRSSPASKRDGMASGCIGGCSPTA